MLSAPYRDERAASAPQSRCLRQRHPHQQSTEVAGIERDIAAIGRGDIARDREAKSGAASRRVEIDPPATRERGVALM